MERKEENISNHNEEQSFLFSLLQKMTQIIEYNNNNDEDISTLLASIFSEFININPEPIHPNTQYTIRWSDTITDEIGMPHVLQYEIEFIPELY